MGLVNKIFGTYSERQLKKLDKKLVVYYYTYCCEK